MIDYIQAWQCIGCGKIEAPQPCIGVCRDRKILMVGKDDYERALAEVEALRAQQARLHGMLQRFGLAKVHEGQWERSWLALQAQVREALALLDASPVGPSAH
ncbi:hypothetical protein [Dyella sedimenti]|uniref:hypothetical protein n=1 Tax=Dyella sedimenti TaxID=2919947 RepID=UPI001FAAD5C1|nr:hypothetical protein [Dyella sedimenti]